MATTFQVNDIGVQFVIEVKQPGGASALDISSSNSRQLVLLSPDGTRSVKTASLFTDGTDGMIVYLTVDGDLNVKGRWKYQAIIGFPDGSQLHGPVVKFKVKENI